MNEPLQEDLDLLNSFFSASKPCTKCGKDIDGEFIELGEEVFHSECFTCGKCGCELAGERFIKREGIFFCETDYHKTYSSKCHACDKFVTGKIIPVGEHFFHPKCFNCTVCGLVFDEANERFYEEEEKYYCKKDYFATFGKACGLCGDPITDGNMFSANGKQFHPHCFTCAVDGEVIKQGDGFNIYKNKIYCSAHFKTKFVHKCRRCEETVDGQYISAKGLYYHGKCFNCGRCKNPLRKGQVRFFLDDFFCTPCYVKKVDKEIMDQNEARENFEMLTQISPELSQAEFFHPDSGWDAEKVNDALGNSLYGQLKNPQSKDSYKIVDPETGLEKWDVEKLKQAVQDQKNADPEVQKKAEKNFKQLHNMIDPNDPDKGFKGNQAQYKDPETGLWDAVKINEALGEELFEQVKDLFPDQEFSPEEFRAEDGSWDIDKLNEKLEEGKAKNRLEKLHSEDPENIHMFDYIDPVTGKIDVAAVNQMAGDRLAEKLKKLDPSFKPEEFKLADGSWDVDKLEDEYEQQKAKKDFEKLKKLKPNVKESQYKDPETGKWKVDKLNEDLGEELFGKYFLGTDKDRFQTVGPNGEKVWDLDKLSNEVDAMEKLSSEELKQEQAADNFDILQEIDPFAKKEDYFDEKSQKWDVEKLNKDLGNKMFDKLKTKYLPKALKKDYKDKNGGWDVQKLKKDLDTAEKDQKQAAKDFDFLQDPSNAIFDPSDEKVREKFAKENYFDPETQLWNADQLNADVGELLFDKLKGTDEELVPEEFKMEEDPEKWDTELLKDEVRNNKGAIMYDELCKLNPKYNNEDGINKFYDADTDQWNMPLLEKILQEERDVARVLQLDPDATREMFELENGELNLDKLRGHLENLEKVEKIKDVLGDMADVKLSDYYDAELGPTMGWDGEKLDGDHKAATDLESIVNVVESQNNMFENLPPITVDKKKYYDPKTKKWNRKNLREDKKNASLLDEILAANPNALVRHYWKPKRGFDKEKLKKDKKAAKLMKKIRDHIPFINPDKYYNPETGEFDHKAMKKDLKYGQMLNKLKKINKYANVLDYYDPKTGKWNEKKLKQDLEAAELFSKLRSLDPEARKKKFLDPNNAWNTNALSKEVENRGLLDEIENNRYLRKNKKKFKDSYLDPLTGKWKNENQLKKDAESSKLLREILDYSPTLNVNSYVDPDTNVFNHDLIAKDAESTRKLRELIENAPILNPRKYIDPKTKQLNHAKIQEDLETSRNLKAILEYSPALNAAAYMNANNELDRDLIAKDFESSKLLKELMDLDPSIDPTQFVDLKTQRLDADKIKKALEAKKKKPVSSSANEETPPPVKPMKHKPGKRSNLPSLPSEDEQKQRSKIHYRPKSNFVDRSSNNGPSGKKFPAWMSEKKKYVEPAIDWDGSTEAQKAETKGPQDYSVFFNFAQLTDRDNPLPGIKWSEREQYLHPAEFKRIFGMDKAEFNKMIKWQRVQLKKQVGLF